MNCWNLTEGNRERGREGVRERVFKENKEMEDRVKRKTGWRRQQVKDIVGLFLELKHWINHHFIRSSSNSSFRHQRVPSFSTTSHPQSSGQWTAQIWAKRSWEIVLKVNGGSWNALECLSKAWRSSGKKLSANGEIKEATIIFTDFKWVIDCYMSSSSIT